MAKCYDRLGREKVCMHGPGRAQGSRIVNHWSAQVEGDHGVGMGFVNRGHEDRTKAFRRRVGHDNDGDDV